MLNFKVVAALLALTISIPGAQANANVRCKKIYPALSLLSSLT